MDKNLLFLNVLAVVFCVWLNALVFVRIWGLSEQIMHLQTAPQEIFVELSGPRENTDEWIFPKICY